MLVALHIRDNIVNTYQLELPTSLRVDGLLIALPHNMATLRLETATLL